MYAEAKIEAGEIDESVYDAINQIRNRVVLPPIESGKTEAELREIIRHERRIEFAGEGLYYNDIRRWKIMDEVMTGPVFDYNHEIIGERNFKPARDYIWPISSEVLEQNPNLEQNPGYGN